MLEYRRQVIRNQSYLEELEGEVAPDSHFKQ